MTKQDIINNIGKKSGIEKSVVSYVIENFMEEIRDNIADGQSIFLRGFGTFTPKLRREKPARNISRGTAITIPAHKVPHFKPCPKFKDLMK